MLSGVTVAWFFIPQVVRSYRGGRQRIFPFLLAMITLLAGARSAAAEEPLRVAAAISLREPFQEIAARYESLTGERIELVVGASGQLLAQIRAGADVDLFISAANTQVDELERDGQVVSGPRRIIALNTLVLIVPADARAAPASFAALADPAMGRIAIGDPQTVPAGQYAMRLFDALRLTDAVRGRLLYAANVRQVLDYVARGEVSAGLVYATDARLAKEKVRVVAIAQTELREPISYPAVIIKRSPRVARAQRFLDFVGSADAQQVLRSYGFITPDAASTTLSGATALTATGPGLWGPLWLSLRIALAATALAVLVGVPAAYLLSRRRFHGRSAVEALLLVPLVLPPTVVGYVIIVLLGRNGFLGADLHAWTGYSILFRFEGAVLAAAIVAMPLVYLPARGAFASVERELEDIARLYGANRLQLFWHVSLPLATRGLASGTMLAFARALGEFGATLMVFGWGPDRQTLPISIYAASYDGRLSAAAGSVIALLVVSFAVIGAYNASTFSRQR